VSTQLYHGQRLDRAHLDEIAAHGFDAIEIVATGTHVDYHDAAALDTLAVWLRETGLRLHSIHAPVTDAVVNGRWSAPFNNASPVEAVRARAVAETVAALDLARRVPVEVLVVHLGLPDVLAAGPGDNDPAAARRSVGEIAAAARSVGVRVALENIPGPLATPAALAALVEHDLDDRSVGLCLDFGHAHLMDGVPDAIETMGGLLAATHVHDNHGARDEHLPPGEGTIDWPAAVMGLLKVGYDGLLMIECAAGGAPTGPLLERARRACARLDDEARSGS
jgi:sugar phosphate isomerase/epimerase